MLMNLSLLLIGIWSVVYLTDEVISSTVLLALVKAFVFISLSILCANYSHFLPQSFITALAGQIEYNICLLSISENGMTDDRLNHALSIIPEQSIVLLEDIDRAFVTLPQEHPAGVGFSSRVTLSGLLNALDGVAATERRIIFMTTNHIERLDPALIRPGRVDVKVYLGDASRGQIIRMYERFYKDTNDSTYSADKFADLIATRSSVSMASLQGHFMKFKTQPQLAFAQLDELFKKD
jgi:mitochondrial chaperone BCS1